MAGAVGSLGDLVRNVTSGWLGARNGNGTDAEVADADADAVNAGGDGPPDDGVQRITVR
jgi:hypothetical protein